MSPLSEFKELFNSARDTVLQNETKFYNFALEGYKTIVKSDGFDGCFGIVVASTKACVIAHASQTETEVQSALKEISDHYMSTPGNLLNEKIYIYSQVNLTGSDFLLYNKIKTELEEMCSLEFPTIEEVKYKASTGNPPFGALVVKCNGKGNQPTVKFITSDMQWHSVLIFILDVTGKFARLHWWSK